MSFATSFVESTIVRAGAGAGKTTRLISHIFSYAKEFKKINNKLPRIIVCTFTRKATQELRERLLKESIQQGDQELIKYINSSNLHISTIHGVLLKFLSLYGYRLGLDPQFTFINNNESLKHAKKLIKNILVAKTLDETSVKLILDSYDINTLAKFAQKYYEFKSAYPELRASDESSFAALFGLSIVEEIEQTSRFLLELSALNGSKPIFREFCDWLGQMPSVLKEVQFSCSTRGFFSHLEGMPKFRVTAAAELYEHRLKEIREYYSELKKKLDLPAYNSQNWKLLAESYSALDKIFSEFYKKYKELKINLGQLQISDLESFSLELARLYPDTANLFSVDWDYWLVDEYQDTSPIQVELIRYLQGKRHSFTVGDPQQSIYLFRGARCEVFSQKEKEIESSSGSLQKLDINYRSRPELVSFFNYVFKGMPAQFFSMKSGKTSDAEFETDVEILLANDLNPKESLAISKVSSLINSGVTPDSICILSRTNKKLKSIARKLAASGVACLLHSAGGFYDRREVLDALTLLKFLVNPNDNINLIELLRSPWFVLDDQLILTHFVASGKKSIWLKIEEEELYKQISTLSNLRGLLKERNSIGIYSTFLKALVNFGFFDFSHHLDMTGRREANLWKLVLDLELAMKSPGFNFINFAREFISELNLEKESDQDAISARETNRVNLMTIHQSKGLEFEHIIVLDIDVDPMLGARQKPRWSFDEVKKEFSGSVYLPTENEVSHSLSGISAFDHMRKLELEESYRVFYVALTRAVKTITLVGVNKCHADSWQALLKLNFNPGKYVSEGFKYTVLDSLDSTLNKKQSDLKITKVRGPYSDTTNLESKALSVSEIVKDGWRESESLFNPQKLINKIQSANRGVLLHQLFESMHNISTEDLDWVLKQNFPQNSNQLRNTLNWLNNIKTPPIKKLFETGHSEWGFIFKSESNKTIEGQIDLWGEVDDIIWIVDYKTGSSDFTRLAFDQMYWYAKAVRAMGKTKPIKLVAIYPFEEKVELEDYKG